MINIDCWVLVLSWLLVAVFSARLIKLNARYEKRDFRLGSQFDMILRDKIDTCNAVLCFAFIASVFSAYRVDYRILGIHIFVINPFIHLVIYFCLKKLIRGNA